MHRFFCSSCGTQLKASPSSAGATITCPKCKQKTIVPSNVEPRIQADPVRPPQPTRSPASVRDENPRNSAYAIPVWAMLVGGGGLLVAVLLCFVLIVLYLSGGNRGQQNRENDNKQSPPTLQTPESSDKWIVGKWEAFIDEQRLAWEFYSFGHYDHKVRSEQLGDLGTAAGQWFIRNGRLTATVDVSFIEHIPVGTSYSFEIENRTRDRFTLHDPASGRRMVLLRKS